MKSLIVWASVEAVSSIYSSLMSKNWFSWDNTDFLVIPPL